MNKYFWVPRSIFEIDMNVYETVLYTVLCKFTNAADECFPSRRTICEYADICESTYRKYTKNLIHKHLINKISRYTAKGRQTSNLYKLYRNLKTCFKVPVDIFSRDLSTYAICVYLYLCKCADIHRQCFPSQLTIAKACGMSRQTVSVVLKELREKHMIATYAQKRAYDNGNGVLLYDLNIERKKLRTRNQPKKITVLLSAKVACRYIIYLHRTKKCYNIFKITQSNQMTFYIARKKPDE